VFKKKPCSICRRWFRPDARQGPRQKTCSSEACQRERHRRACRDWREREHDVLIEDRLRKRLVGSEGELMGPVVRDAIGLEASVIIQESVRLLSSCMRDASGMQPIEITRESIRLRFSVTRDTTAARGPPT
jgi:hypothetical protein